MKTSRGIRLMLITSLVLIALSTQIDAARLAPKTLAAFNRYVSLTEARMDDEVRTGRGFLWIDTSPAATRRELVQRLARGEVVVERLQTRDGGRRIEAPDGLIHHWVGTVFIRAPLDRIVRIMQDYDHHDRLFAPAVAQSALRSRTDDDFKVHLRFFRKKIVTVVIDTENDIRYEQLGTGRAQFRAYSTKVSEVEDVGTKNETVRPPDDGRGFMWRLNTYGRMQEGDGGTYVQFETITLSRDIPFGLGWLIGPFVTSVPRESLAFTLDRLRDNGERRDARVPGTAPPVVGARHLPGRIAFRIAAAAS
jgi:hypothetical protein